MAKRMRNIMNKKDILQRREFLKKGVSSVAAMRMFGGTATLGSLLLPQNAIAMSSHNFTDYKALVCLYLGGGSDGMNMLIPKTSSDYKQYVSARQRLAVSREDLLSISPSKQNRYDVGFNPRLEKTKDIFDSGKLAVLSNIGPLARPIEKSDLVNPNAIPPYLFSHNSQTAHWLRGHFDTTDASGWAGRAADRIQNVQANIPMNYSVGSLATELQIGQQSGVMTLVNGDVNTIEHIGVSDSDQARVKSAYEELISLAKFEGNLLEKNYAITVDEISARIDNISGIINGAPSSNIQLPSGNKTAQSLEKIAQIISQAEQLGQQRQIFVVRLGGWDTHGDSNQRLEELLPELDGALDYFNKRIEDIGMSDVVTSFTLSDFGRSLSSNGDGTDHGWGNYHMVMGGAVKGDIYGNLMSMELGGERDYNGAGRMIPEIASEQLGSTLLSWFGLPESDLYDIFPNLKEFDSYDLGFMS